MMKIVYIFLVVSLFIACKSDNVDNKATATSETPELKENKKRILKAERVYTKEDLEKKQAVLDKKKQETKAIADELKYRKAKAARDYARKQGLDKRSNEPVDSKMVDKGKGLKIGDHYEFASYDLPSACDLLSSKWIGNSYNTPADEILIKNASSPKTKYARSCFFKWEVDVVANGGIMLQLQGNPIPRETDTWVTDYIINKRKEGDTSMSNPDQKVSYSDLPGLGDAAVYNYDLNRCYWRVGNDYLFMLAFNLGMSEEEERAAALKIGKEVTKNFKKIKR